MSVFVASMSIKILGMVREVGNPNLFCKICFAIIESSLELKQLVEQSIKQSTEN